MKSGPPHWLAARPIRELQFKFLVGHVTPPVNMASLVHGGKCSAADTFYLHQFVEGHDDVRLSL